MVTCPREQTVERLLADPAWRHVHNPQECLVIARILEQPQPRDDVTDFSPLEELEPPHQLVGHAPAAQSHFQRPGEGVGPKENGDVPRGPGTAGNRSGDFIRNAISFVVAGRIEHDPNRRPWGSIRDQSFRFPTAIVCDEAIGCAENIGRAAIVVFEFDDRGRGIIPLEFQNVADARAPPAVNRLIWIACHREIRVVDREPPHDAILHRVRILVFVNKNPAVPRVEHPS